MVLSVSMRVFFWLRRRRCESSCQYGESGGGLRSRRPARPRRTPTDPLFLLILLSAVLCGPPEELWRVHAGGIERIPQGADFVRSPAFRSSGSHSRRYSSVPSTVSSFSVARSASSATSSTRRGSSSRSTVTRPTTSSSSRSTRPASSSRSVNRRLPRFHSLLRPLAPASSLCLCHVRCLSFFVVL